MSGPLPEITARNQPYWDGTALGELRIRKCNNCGALSRFTSELCPACWSANFGWQVASGRGTIVSFSRVEIAPFPAMEDRVPYVVALIELAEGPTMMSNIVDGDINDVRVGLPVELVFEKRGDFQLPQFRLAAGPP